MDLDELIKISVDKTNEQDVVWNEQDQEKEIEKQIESLGLRISSQNKPDLQLASLQELATMAQQYPEKISELFQTFLQIITQQVATAQADQVYDIFMKICGTQGEISQKLLDKIIKVDCFIQFLIEHVKIYKGQAGLEFFLYILTNDISKNSIQHILQNTDKQPEYFSDQSQFIKSLLQINTENSHKLLDLILFDVLTSEQITQLYNDKQNLLSVLIQIVQQDRLLSSTSTYSCDMLVKLLNHDKTSKETYTQCIFFIQELVKMFQGIAYQVLQNNATSINLQCLLSVIQLLYIILTKSDANVKNFYSSGKIFDYCAMLIQICPTQTTSDQQQLTVLCNIADYSIQILQILVDGNDQVLLMLAVCFLQKQQKQPQPNVEPPQVQLADYLLQIAFSRYLQHDITLHALKLFIALLQNQDVSMSVAAGFSKPVRAACRGTVIDGFKLIARAFFSGAQLGSNQNTASKEQEKADPAITQYIQQSQVNVRQQLLKLQPPKYEMSFNICKQIIDQLLSNNQIIHQEQFVQIFQYLFQQRDQCLHFLGSVLDNTELNKVKSQNNVFKAENVSSLLYKNLADQSQRNALILQVLSQASKHLEKDLFYQLIFQNVNGNINDILNQIELLCKLYSAEKQSVSRLFSVFPYQLIDVISNSCDNFSLQFLQSIQTECTESDVKQCLEALINKHTVAETQAMAQAQAQVQIQPQTKVQTKPIQTIMGVQTNAGDKIQALGDVVPRAQYEDLLKQYQNLEVLAEQQRQEIYRLNQALLRISPPVAAPQQSLRKRRAQHEENKEMMQFFVPQSETDVEQSTVNLDDVITVAQEVEQIQPDRGFDDTKAEQVIPISLSEGQNVRSE